MYTYMGRHLLLISNPGNPNDKNYVKTTEEAINRWESFFRSPIGGYWQDNEISRYGESRPITPDAIKRLMIPLNTVQCEYSIIVFCGHGGCTLDNQDAIQLPIPSTGDCRLLPVDALLGEGLPFVRRTVILDSCRSLIPFASTQLFEDKQFSSIYKTDGIECGKYYNDIVMQASPHVEVLYSTSEHHKAFASKEGSAYTDAMSNLVRMKSLWWKSLAINDRFGMYCYSMCDLHKDITSDLVGRNLQTPDYRIIGQANRSYPFVAMHLPTDRTIFTDGAVIEILED